MSDNDDLINGCWAAVQKNHNDTEANDYVNLRTAIGLRVVKIGPKYHIGADYPTGVALLRMMSDNREWAVRERMVAVMRGLR
ncbi:hypothetical protein AB0L86_31825 [Micromonospora musae]|uniref:hypothetical protein n=1 Tax=Micromonospora musae TaxID=1894970 RepID=UPI00341F159E